MSGGLNHLANDMSIVSPRVASQRRQQPHDHVARACKSLRPRRWIELGAMRGPGESYSDVILRLASIEVG